MFKRHRLDLDEDVSSSRKRLSDGYETPALYKSSSLLQCFACCRLLCCYPDAN